MVRVAVGPVLAVHRQQGTDARVRRAGPGDRHPAAHPPRRDPGRGGTTAGRRPACPPPSSPRNSAGSPMTCGWRTACTSTMPRSAGSPRPAPASRTAPARTAGSASGIAPVRKLLAAGRAGGTRRGRPGLERGARRWPASCARRCWPPARQDADATALTARQALWMGTRGGARCLGRDGEIGSLRPGALADVALWRLDTLAHDAIAHGPGGDPVAALVLGQPAPLALLLVGGRRVVAGRRAAHCRRGCGRRRGPGGQEAAAAGGRAVSITTASPARSPGRPASPAAWARAPGAPTPGRRSPASSPTPLTCGWMACCGARPCAARIRARSSRLDIGGALARAGRRAVLTHEDVPGRKITGWSSLTSRCSPSDQVRYQGEPVALVAADHPETARRAAAKSRLATRCLTR